MYNAGDTPNHNVDPNALVSPNPPLFLSQLKIYNGTFSGESIWKIFMRSFPFVLSPVVGHVLFGVKYSLDNGALMYLIDVVRVPRILHANNTAQYVPRFLSPVFVAWPQANN